MAVLIKDAEADRLIRELAARTGETITEAVKKAAEQRLAQLPPNKGRIDRAKLAQAQAYSPPSPAGTSTSATTRSSATTTKVTSTDGRRHVGPRCAFSARVGSRGNRRSHR